jgi:transketolase C-terminal domain/subunit
MLTGSAVFIPIFFAGIDAAVIRLCVLNPLPLDALESALAGYQIAVVVEEAAANSGIWDAISNGLSHRIPELKIHGINLGEDFMPHGAMQKLYEHCGLDAKSIAEYIQEVLPS